MNRSPLVVLAALAAALLLSAPAGAQSATPTPGALYDAGPSGRYLMGGEWLFRLDRRDRGVRDGFQTNPSRQGWESVRVPNTWNLNDNTNEGFLGTVGWYRKDFRLPSARAALAWIVRFESVNYRSKVWLNGRPLGTHRGAYLPFEMRLPPSLLRRGGLNRIVVRVDNRRRPTDFPPSGLSATGLPTGGWWNYGGLLREVYLRKVDRADLTTLQVQPDLPCATCAATVRIRATVRNVDTRAHRMSLGGTFGNQRVRFAARSVGAKRFVTFTTDLRVARPRLWEPGRPNLYKLRLAVGVKGAGVVQRWRTDTGIRSVKVSQGRLMLNGRPLNFRGVGLHEDSPDKGFAIDNERRARFVRETQAIGGTLIRSHYPLHPQLHEVADRAGVMIWSEIPVYAIKTRYLKQKLVRQLAARELEENILINGNHPSVITWSIGNELSARPGPVQGFYIARAARSAKALDPTRPVSYAVAGYPSAGCQPEYGPLDMIGINDYFGWYPGPNGSIADRTRLSEYLDAVRACYPDKAIVASETGAEANRDGPVEEKGTYAFQSDFVNFHMGVYASKPWLSGAVWWALQEFRVRPGWEGGNPRASPPLHQKGVLRFDFSRKPAWYDLQRIYRQTVQLGQRRR